MQLKHRILLSFAVLVTIAGLLACGSSTSNTGTNVSGTPTSAATPRAQHFHVGQTVKVGDTWQVTVNSTKTSRGDDFTTPAAGNTFVIVDVTLKNLSTTEQNVSSALNFSLQDATGQKYNEAILSGKTPPDGKVEAGSLLRGQLSYEVPTTQHSLTLSFQGDIVSGGQTVWDLKV